MPVQITRRRLLITTALVPLAACGGVVTPNPNPTPGPSGDLSVLIGEVSDLTAGLVDKLLPLLGTVADLSPETAAKIRGGAATTQALAGQVAEVLSIDDAKPLVQQIGPIALQIVSALAGLPGMPLEVSLLLSAVSVLVPIITNMVGLSLPRAMPRFAGYREMTPEQARTVLRTGRL